MFALYMRSLLTGAQMRKQMTTKILSIVMEAQGFGKLSHII